MFQHGDAFILRSVAEITPVVNGSVRIDLVRKLFVSGKNCGNLFFCVKKIAMEISLRTSDGRVDTVLSGKDGFVCYPYLYYQGNYRKETHTLSVRVNSIRLASAGLKNRDFCFFCDQEKEPLHEGIIDHAGRAACAERSVLLESPEPGDIDFIAADGITDEVLTLQDGEARVSLPLAEVMLFAPYSHRQIKPRTSGASFLFGSRRFVLYAVTGMLEDSLQFENCEAETISVVGEYLVSNLIWKNQSQPCRIQTRMPGGQVITWDFEKCLHFNLYINRKKDSSPEHVVFREDQGHRPANFELVLNPFPDKDARRKLFWNIIVNNSNPLKITLADCCSDHADDNSLRISGVDLEKMLRPLWDRKSLVNASVEISLCAMDETLVSRRFFVFPSLNVILPEGVRDGEQFPVQVDLGEGNNCRELLLKNPRGRSKIKVRFEYEDEKWQLRRLKFKGRLEIEALETSLDIEAIPPCRAVRFGNRDKGRAEPAREILRRELGPYDLLVAAASQSPPEVTVNGKKQKVCFSRVSKELWCLALAALAGIVKQENQVTIRSPGFEELFTVKFRVALIKIEVLKYLTDRTVIGSCSFRGPVGSHIELSLTPVLRGGALGDPISIFLEPDGNEVCDHSFAMKLPDSAAHESVDHYELTAVLVDNPVADPVGYEYGKRWEFLPESAVSQNDFGYLKERIFELLESRKPFAAAKHLVAARNIVPDSEQDWFRETEKAVNQMLVRTSLNRVASQIAGVLKKEYLFEV